MFLRLLDDRFAVAEGRLNEMTCSLEDLYEEELAAVQNAVARRRHEFISGRVLARRAMTTLGATAQPIPSGPDRSPVWPHGLVGSITHSNTWCAAAVARAQGIRSVGIDVEELTTFEPELLQTVCTPNELKWLSALPAGERMVGATVLFSAKETVFKAQYPLTGRMLGHHDVEVVVSPGWRDWIATSTKAAADDTWEGCLLVEPGMVATSVVIPVHDDS